MLQPQAYGTRNSFPLSRRTVIDEAEAVSDWLFEHEERARQEAPVEALQVLFRAGLMTAPLPTPLGGLGLGTERGGHRLLLRTLAAFGSADLALGRLVEGHFHALILIHAFGTPDQLHRAAQDAHAGRLFGVWNTGDATPMRFVDLPGDELLLQGVKTFATGAAIVDRPLLTAERNGWQMAVPRMETPCCAAKVRIDRDAWMPFGMESSESFTIDFTGARMAAHDLIGKPGDFYRDPLFHGGAIRFAAVQLGGMLRLRQIFGEWLAARGRERDPYQVARLGEIEQLTHEAVAWVEGAADVAERCLWPSVQPGSEAAREMVRRGHMTRLGVERAATALMSRVTAGVGAHGLLRPARFQRILRDLTMYLRQPNPDGTLAEVGRSALSESMPSPWTALADSTETGAAVGPETDDMAQVGSDNA